MALSVFVQPVGAEEVFDHLLIHSTSVIFDFYMHEVPLCLCAYRHAFLLI